MLKLKLQGAGSHDCLGADSKSPQINTSWRVERGTRIFSNLVACLFASSVLSTPKVHYQTLDVGRSLLHISQTISLKVLTTLLHGRLVVVQTSMRSPDVSGGDQESNQIHNKKSPWFSGRGDYLHGRKRHGLQERGTRINARHVLWPLDRLQNASRWPYIRRTALRLDQSLTSKGHSMLAYVGIWKLHEHLLQVSLVGTTARIKSTKKKYQHSFMIFRKGYWKLTDEMQIDFWEG